MDRACRTREKAKSHAREVVHYCAALYKRIAARPVFVEPPWLQFG